MRPSQPGNRSTRRPRRHGQPGRAGGETGGPSAGGRLGGDDEAAGAREAFEDAALYDWEYRRRRDDVAFYRMLAGEMGGPLLDLGCGTGRLLLPLVRDGHRVVGIDHAASMLARAAGRVARLPAAAAGRARLVRADLRALPVPAGSFAMAIAAFHGVQHLVDDRDLLALFRDVRRALVPGGWFAFDVFVPDPRWLRRPSNRWFDLTVFRHPTTGRRTAYSLSHTLDAARRALHMRMRYQPLSEAGRRLGPARVVRLCHRQLSPPEVRALLRRADLELAAAWDGWGGQPLDETAPAPNAGAEAGPEPGGTTPPSEQHVYLARRRGRRRPSP